MSESKGKLLEVAGKTFGRYGFYKTSMDEIAKKARKAKGSLYYHFNSKELLFTEVVKAELNLLKEELQVIFNQKDADSREIIRAYMLKRMLVLKASINYQETLRPEFYEFYEFVNDSKNEMDQWEKEQIIKILNYGITAGQLDMPGDVNIHAEVLVMMLKGLEMPFFLKGEYDRLEAHFDSLISVITKGISKTQTS